MSTCSTAARASIACGGDDGSDTYLVGRGSGHDWIGLSRSGATASRDHLVFDSDITPADISLRRDAGDLIVLVAGSDTRLTISGDRSSDADSLDFSFADGTVWAPADIASRVVTPSTTVTTDAQGVVTVTTGESRSLALNENNLTLTGDYGAAITGNDGNNVLTGNSGNNVFNGPGTQSLDIAMGWDVINERANLAYHNGIDTLVGGAGDDLYFVGVDEVETDVNRDVIIEATGGGNDTVFSFAYGTDLPDNVENLVGFSQSTWDIIEPGSRRPLPHGYVGNALNNVIDASAVLGTIDIDGGAGADTMVGSLQGFNTFHVDTLADVIVAAPGRSASMQTVVPTIDYVLPDTIGNLTLMPVYTHPVPIHGTGNGLGNVMRSTNSWVDSSAPGAPLRRGLGDTLEGLGGDDDYFIDQGDHVVEATGGGTDRVVVSVHEQVPVNAADYANVEIVQLKDTGTLLGTAAADRLVGGAWANLIEGGDGNDEITDTDIGSASTANDELVEVDRDTLHGGAGDDRLVVMLGHDDVVGGAGNDTVVLKKADSVPSHLPSAVVHAGLGSGHDTVQAEGFADGQVPILQVNFDASVDVTDLVASRHGNDLTVGINASDDVTVRDFVVQVDGMEKSRAQVDLGFGQATYADLASNLNVMTHVLNARIATGNRNLVTEGDDVLLGTHGADVLGGAGGNDQLLSGDGADTLSGGLGDDSLWGGAGDDRLSGGTGRDDLQGGDGNDVYVIELGETAQIAETSGIDTIQFGAGIRPEDIVVSDFRPLLSLSTRDGSTFVDVQFGLATPDELDSGDTSDHAVESVRFADGTVWTLQQLRDKTIRREGTSGADTLTGTDHGNYLLGLGGNDLLEGLEGNDTLDGGAGNDTLNGGTGDDLYIVDSAGDVLSETAAGGIDTVQSSVTRSLASNFENLTLVGAAVIDGTGNGLNNVLVGNAAANALNGGAGADTMQGGAGNDTYTVDNLGDVVVESAGEGTDLVKAGVNHTLADNVENLTLTGSAGLIGTGNALANVLTGNTGANLLSGGQGADTLDGGAGADSMLGGAGDYTYTVDNAGDMLTENAGEGSDTVNASLTWTLGRNFENLTLINANAIDGIGNELDNLLFGNSGANTLSGGDGNDTYSGGAGNDVLSDSSTTSNDVYRWGRGFGLDTVTDAGGTDRIEIGTGISAAQLTQARNGNNLVLGISGASDKLTITNYYVGTANKIESIKLADGSSVTVTAQGAGTGTSGSGGAPTEKAMPVLGREHSLASLARRGAIAAAWDAVDADYAQPERRPDGIPTLTPGQGFELHGDALFGALQATPGKSIWRGEPLNRALL